MQTGSDVKYFIADHLGSTNALTDASGNVTSSATYDSFGNAAGNLATRYKFTGREYDDFTGLHYYRARWYDSNLGRFISEDPIGFAGGDVNLYGYVGNNSLALRDPSGEIPVLIPILIGAGALILASPSYTNAPGECDPRYDSRDNLVANGVMGMAGGYVIGRFLGPMAGRLIFGQGDEIIELGIAGGPVPRGYAPSSPLPSQTVGGVDIPTPLPEAQGPHTTLGTRIGGDGVAYRQSATFPVETFPKANGQSVPWSRVDWTDHGRPWDHPSPHQHTFYLQSDGTWRLGGPSYFSK